MKVINNRGANNVEAALSKLSFLWEKNAKVKGESVFKDLYLDRSKSDFLPDLIPFYGSELWHSLDNSKQNILISYGWILYNLKTIQIESSIVTPSCMDFLKAPFPTDETNIINQSICETLTDEAYHILLAVKSCDMIYSFRDLKRLPTPEFKLLEALNKKLEIYKLDWQRRLVRLAYASVSETMISDYLSLISDADEIQLFCKIAVKAHAEDERIHSSVFTLILQSVYPNLSLEEKTFFLSMIKPAVSAFKDNEIKSWEHALKYAGLSKNEIADALTYSQEINIDTRGVNRMLKKIGTTFDEN